MSPQQTTLKRLLSYLAPYKKELTVNTILGILNGVCSVAVTFFIGKGMDQLIGPNQVAFRTLTKLTLLMACLTLFASLSQWLIQLIGNKVAYQATASMRKEGLSHLNSLPVRYFDQHSHGDIMSRLGQDLDTISDALVALFSQIFSNIAIIIISLGTMFYLSPVLTGVVLMSTLLIFMVNHRIATRSQRYFQKQQKTMGDITGFLNEQLPHLKTSKAFQQEATIQQRFQEMNNSLNKTGQKAQFVSSLTNPLSRFIDHLGYISIGLVGVILSTSQPHILTIGLISSFIIYSSQFSKPFIELSGIMTQLQTAWASAKRINELLEEPSDVPDVTQGPDLPHTIKGTIDFINVSFSYTPDRPLINHLNLHVPAGQTVAIVGETGAGKSTLVNLLMRFYDVDSGTILLDGIPITDIPRHTLREQFGMVLQETWLFSGTVWDNLTFGYPEASREVVEQACKEASIYHFIQSLPNGFETSLGDRSFTISEGQKQLFTIARTMISQPKLLILDEATSAVDSLTEQMIQKAFLSLMKGKTSFVIAHRLSTIQQADIILVMSKGDIVEMGSHESLLSNTTGYYHQLYHAQFKQTST